MSRRFGVSLVALAVLLLQGCGGSDETATYPVTGSVSLAGKPIEEGCIVFDPVDGQGGSAMGSIENGKFTAEVPAGEKILRINADQETEQKDEYGELITISLIPDKYDSESELRRTVTPTDENNFDLALD